MNQWVWTAIVIESMALLGVVGVSFTKRTQFAFVTGFNTILPVTIIYLAYAPAFATRQMILLGMVLIYLAHINWLLLFQQRHTAISKLNTQIPLSQKVSLSFILTNAAGWGYCLPFYFAARRTEGLGAVDYAVIIVYLLGTIIHFGSDYQKVRFKAKSESHGKVLDTGFWRFSRHPNYFGDFLIYISFALIGGNIWSWVAPLLNLLQYLFDAIPKNEQWALQRYGKSWEEYVRHTKKFIPFIY